MKKQFQTQHNLFGGEWTASRMDQTTTKQNNKFLIEKQIFIIKSQK